MRLYRRGLILFLVVSGPSIGAGPLYAPPNPFNSPPPTPPPAAQKSDDPYTTFKIRKLDNGLQIVLGQIPTSNRTTVWIQVDAGIEDEPAGKTGVAHVTEHSMFRDPGLGDKSFLDLLRQEGAETNAYTRESDTVYFSTVPAEKLDWLIALYGRMFRTRIFDADLVESAKKEVLIEIKNEFHIGEGLLTTEMKRLMESEFGLREHPGRGLGVVLSTKRIDDGAVQNFYATYYHPANMHMTITGKFDETKLMATVQKEFSAMSSAGKAPRVEPPPEPREQPFVRVSAGLLVPRVTLGTKFWDINAIDHVVVNSYFEDLALRFMEKVRTARAETYTATPFVMEDTRNFGFGFVSFDTTPEAYERNLDYLDGWINAEAREGKIGDAAIESAKKHYLAKINNTDSDLAAINKAANEYFEFRRSFKTETTPFQLLSSISNEDYRKSLRKLFQEDRELRILIAPPAAFPFEGVVMFVVSILVGWLFSRTFYFSPLLNSEQARFNKKINIGWGGWVVLTYFVYRVVLTCLLTIALVNHLEQDWSAMQTNFVVRDYLQGFVIVSLFTFTLFSLYCLFPRRIMIIKQRLVLKTMGYYGRSFPLNTIASIDATTYATAKKLVRKKPKGLGLRLSRKGILFRFLDGRSLFVSSQNGEVLVDLIKEQMGEGKRTEHTTSIPPTDDDLELEITQTSVEPRLAG